MLLYDITVPRKPDFQYENYGDQFDLDNLNDNKRNSYIREAVTSVVLYSLPAKSAKGTKTKGRRLNSLSILEHELNHAKPNPHLTLGEWLGECRSQ